MREIKLYIKIAETKIKVKIVKQTAEQHFSLM